MHLELSICQVEGLAVCKTQGLTLNTCNFFYTNLQALYNQHNCVLNHVWNSNEIGIQAGKKVGIKVLAKRRSNVVYITIPKLQE
jgi:hypothetical protein